MKTLKKYILIIGLIFFAMLLYIYFCFFIVKLSKKEYDVELKKERRHELRYNYELAKVYMNEVMLDLDLELSQNGNVYNIDASGAMTPAVKESVAESGDNRETSSTAPTQSSIGPRAK